MNNKEKVIAAIRKFIGQRSGISFADYQTGDWKASREAFMGDYRPMLRDGQDARVLLAAVSGRDGISFANIVEATNAFSGRLSVMVTSDVISLEYTTGQYFPTEYRKAACAVKTGVGFVGLCNGARLQHAGKDSKMGARRVWTRHCLALV